MATSQENNDNTQPLPESLRAVRAALRGQEDKDQTLASAHREAAETTHSADLFPVSSAAAERENKQEQEIKEEKEETVQKNTKEERRAEEKAHALMIKNAEALIGKKIIDPDGESRGSVYLGIHKIKDEKGHLVGEFNLFAAPADLKTDLVITKMQRLLSFDQAVNHVAKLKNYHGHDGFNHKAEGKKADKALYDAIKDGSYQGEWFIPDADILESRLYKYKDKSALAKTFKDATFFPFSDEDCYWACTEFSKTSACQDFELGMSSSFEKDRQLSVRLVRAEPVVKSTPLPVGMRNIN